MIDKATFKFILKDLWAQLKTKPSLVLGSEVQKSPPYFVNIEPTSFCNLNCKICSFDGSRKNGYISRETVELALKQSAELGVHEIRFFLAGEPFFHPHLHEFIASAKSYGMLTNIHTNATFMPDKRIRRVIDAGLDKISFSFDGESAEEYENVRTGGKFDITLQNICNFLQVKKENGGKFPLVTIQVIKLCGAPNFSIITPEFKNRFKDLPVDQFLLLNPFVWPGQEAQDYNPPHGAKYYPCMVPWNSLSLVWNGDVVWCCGDLNGVEILGNIAQITLKEIWNGEKMRFIRRNLAKGNLKDLPLCRNCEAVYHRHHPVFSDLRDYLRQIKRALK